MNSEVVALTMHSNLCLKVMSLQIRTDIGCCYLVCITMIFLEAFMALAPLKYSRNCQFASISTEIKIIEESLWSPDFQMSLHALQ